MAGTGDQHLPEWDSLMERLASGKEWIIDGNYGRTMDIRLQEADPVIFLDYPAYLSWLRVLKRRVQYHAKTRPDMGEGCPKKVDRQFLKWIFVTAKTKDRKY